jgi:hypothetical protein
MGQAQGQQYCTTNSRFSLWGDDMNDVSLLSLMMTSPTAFFVELKQKPRIWFPMILIIVSTALLNLWYFQVVDFDWLQDNMLTQAFANNPAVQKMPEAERAKMMEQSAKFMSRGFMTGTGVIGTVIAVPLMFAVVALYLLLAGKVVKLNYSFEKWLSMVGWVSLPTVLGNLASIITLAMQSSPVQIAQTDLQVLSLNELFFHRTMGQPGYTLLVSLSIPLLLSQVLTVIGIKVWSERSWQFSAVFALLPTVLIFGIWALVAFG